MSKEDNNPFRSGNTSALDLDQLEKHGEENWNPWNKQRNKKDNPWESKDWSGGAEDWPEEFQGSKGGGTAALDISEFQKEAPDFDDSTAGNAWGKSAKSSQGWGDFDDFFGGGGGTAALDLAGFDVEEDPGEGNLRLKRRAERNEDVRNAHTHSDQKGSLTYEGGQGDPHTESGRSSRAGGRNQTDHPRRQAKEFDIDDLEGEDDEDLMPHESTMAIDIAQIKSAQAPPRDGSGLRKAAGSLPDVDKPMERTEALDIESIRAQSIPVPEPADLFPEESTVAFSIPSPKSASTTDFPRPEAPVSSNKRERIASGGMASRTSMLDKSELEKYRFQEVASGGKFMIFVPGNAPVPFDLRPGVTNVGRERTNHLVLSDPYCSRKHLRIKKLSGKFQALDNGSDNGTLLNGQPMVANQDITLSHGDELCIGSTIMRMVIGTPSPSDQAPPRFQPRRTGSHPAMEPMTDHVMHSSAPNNTQGPYTQQVRAPAEGGGLSTTALVLLVTIILGIIALIAVALVYVFVFQDQSGAAYLLPTQTATLGWG